MREGFLYIHQLDQREKQSPGYRSRIAEAFLWTTDLGVRVDVDHPAFRNANKELRPARSAKVPARADASRARRLAGAGNQLKWLLARFRIVPFVGCQCGARVAEMNSRGVQWCKDNVDLIVGWLREEAAARRLPFVEFGARLLVKRAIRLAAKAARFDKSSTAVQTAIEGQ